MTDGPEARESMGLASEKMLFSHFGQAPQWGGLRRRDVSGHSQT
jgi:hypothetical protein